MDPPCLGVCTTPIHRNHNITILSVKPQWLQSIANLQVSLLSILILYAEFFFFSIFNSRGPRKCSAHYLRSESNCFNHSHAQNSLYFQQPEWNSSTGALMLTSNQNQFRIVSFVLKTSISEQNLRCSSFNHSIHKRRSRIANQPSD